MSVFFKFYDEDRFCSDFNALPAEAQKSLLAYLDRLQEQPEDPTLHTQEYGVDRFAYVFHAQYVVYCHLERDGTQSPARVLRIEILSIVPLKQVLPEPQIHGFLAKLKHILGI